MAPEPSTFTPISPKSYRHASIKRPIAWAPLLSFAKLHTSPGHPVPEPVNTPHNDLFKSSNSAKLKSGTGSDTKTPSGHKRGRPAGNPASGRSRATPATGRSISTAKSRCLTAKKPSYVEPATTTDKDESAGPVA
ncbi:hypothetical protein B0T20DRAFT_488446 [Sordaria brevicollis]|uniref:Uncharacterized protein n=1 Tax=Sordaria brevicollis TaxID=83679 RepID=A0AAE0U6F3_SORBR|nr:hypothetical protein B0T20DRAFT_488446 [Sordaria brevicollis]